MVPKCLLIGKLENIKPRLVAQEHFGIIIIKQIYSLRSQQFHRISSGEATFKKKNAMIEASTNCHYFGLNGCEIVTDHSS